MNTPLYIDTKAWSLVETPGLQSPISQLQYDDCSVQMVLAESFGVMFPNIVKVKRGIKRYEALSRSQTNVMEMATPVKDISQIPKAELMRLMEGWIRLRRKVQDGMIDEKVTSILLNFRVPDPRNALDRYMLYREEGEDRLVICWAYETYMKPSICLEQAIAILMGVPLSRMRSMLSTTMLPSAATRPVRQMVISPEVTNAVNKPSRGRKWYVGLAAMLLVSISLGVYAMTDEGFNEDIVAMYDFSDKFGFSESDPVYGLLERKGGAFDVEESDAVGLVGAEEGELSGLVDDPPEERARAVASPESSAELEKPTIGIVAADSEPIVLEATKMEGPPTKDLLEEMIE